MCRALNAVFPASLKVNSVARLLGQSTGAALVALMFNLAGQNATHVALITAGTLATLAAVISGLRVTQPKAQA